MTGFYSIFYNHPAHFCRGLVVAVVMPQYSAVTQLQRPFCSHAPSQKHRVTSLASSGKGGPAGLFCSPLVFFFFLSFCFPPLHRPQFFSHLFFSEHLLRRFTLAVVDRIKKQRKNCKAGAGDAGDSGLVCGISMRCRADYPMVAMDVAFSKWRCIGGDHSASGPALLCHRDPPVGEAVRATVGGPAEKQHKFQRENQ